MTAEGTGTKTVPMFSVFEILAMSGPDRQNRNTNVQVEGCTGKVRGIGDAIRPSHLAPMAAAEAMMVDVANMFKNRVTGYCTRGHSRRRWRRILVTTLEQPMSTASAPASVSPLQTTPTYEAPAPSAMNIIWDFDSTLRGIVWNKTGQRLNKKTISIE